MSEEKWHVLYTKPRYEKKINESLRKKGIESYLPVIKTLKQWSDRKKIVEIPLFSSYIFIKTNEKLFYTILNIPGTVKFISFEGKAVEISEKEIAKIKWLLDAGIEVSTHNEVFKKGDKVEIIKGPLRGLIAEMVEQNNKHRIVVRLENIDKSIEIQVPRTHLKLI